MSKCLTLLILILVSGCSSPNANNVQGDVIILRDLVYSQKQFPEIVPTLSSNLKIWYTDSCAIEEVKILFIKTDAMRHTTKKEATDHFAFINFATNKRQDYRHFSDTAKYFRSFSTIDTTVERSGVWNFFKTDSIEYFGEPIKLMDTTIGRTTFSRVKFDSLTRLPNLFAIAYFLCDQRHFNFSIDQSYSKRIGCPMVKLSTFAKSNGAIATSSEISFVSDTLSTVEKKIFKRWKTNGIQAR